MTALSGRLDALDAMLVNLQSEQAGVKQKIVEIEGALNGTDSRLGEVEKSVTNYSLSSLLFVGPILPIKVANTNFILNSSLKIWSQVQKAFKLPPTTLSTPIAYNHAFKPSLIDSTFSMWSSKGMVTIRDLYMDEKLFENLS
ncbi:Retrovirus-related Pol poly LINE-1 [Labeo rohita]|uniref:Retrovirus-related Pol poly LINE-1 n=1 Tax=Labeo rohita TaxID=84645 RepID=A0A498NBM4_LABRO|nr:Retrovirus-related Pol poly LINE-1 [Labeo rohita]